MDAWETVYAEVVEATANSDTQLFRGHCNADWQLLPGLARLTSPAEHPEEIAFFDFIIRAGELLPAGIPAWNTAFLMQHHGLPTRLLDWSETFGVALYFALKEGTCDAAVWILDPFELNQRTINRAELIHPKELHGDYEEYFISHTKRLEGDVVAVSPLRHNPRVFNQRAGFTIHDNLNEPLETLHPDVLKKIVIPSAARAGAASFLKLAGISEFALFPDLDGLSREIRAALFEECVPLESA